MIIVLIKTQKTPLGMLIVIKLIALCKQLKLNYDTSKTSYS